MNDLISVIVPVYNSEGFLSKCLESIVNQTYSNLEIIIINDGSTDNSASICDEYACNDNRIKVIHKKNQGVSYARNDGLSIASGNYISFVDSDDYIDSIMYEKMINIMKKNNSKICVCNVSYENSEGIILKKYSLSDFHVDSTKKCLEKLNLINIQGYSCNKLYSRDAIFKSDVNIDFDTNIYVYEDELFNVMVLNDSEISMSYINDAFYHYVLHSSNTVSKFNDKSLTLFKALSEEIKIYNINSCDDLYLKARYYISYIKLKYILKKNKELNIDITNIERLAKIYSKNVKFFKLSNKKIKLKYFIAKYLPFIFKIKINISDNNSIV